MLGGGVGVCASKWLGLMVKKSMERAWVVVGVVVVGWMGGSNRRVHQSIHPSIRGPRHVHPSHHPLTPTHHKTASPASARRRSPSSISTALATTPAPPRHAHALSLTLRVWFWELGGGGGGGGGFE